MLWQIKLAAGIAIVAALFGGYRWIGHSAVEEYKQGVVVKQAEADKALQEKYDDLAAELIVVKASRKTVYKTITKTVERIVKEPASQVPCVSQEGVDVANKALAGGSANEVF